MIPGAGRIFHEIRSAYGFTDLQITEQIEQYGQAWINEVIGFINEDKKREAEEEIERRRWMVYSLPLARTPMDSRGGNSMSSYSKELLRALDEMLPWKKEEKDREIKARLKRPPQVTKPRNIE